MSLILDAGALIACERNNRDVWRRLQRAFDHGVSVRTSAAVVAQVWRDPSGRQSLLARVLAAIEVQRVDELQARQAGVLLARAATSDAIDAILVLLAADEDTILTSDHDDIAHLVRTARIRARVLRC